MPNNGSARTDYQQAMNEIKESLSEAEKDQKKLKEKLRKRKAREYEHYYVSYERRAKKARSIVFEDPKNPKYKKIICWYPPCGQTFWSLNPHIRYCKDQHREWHYGMDICEGARWLNQKRPA